jgi:thiamine monophosphate kinase
VARVLNRDAAIHGAIDVSDGFALDLVRMCEKAGAGCVVESSALSPSGPLAEHTTKHLDYMLHGGEDYALILAVDEHRAEAIVKRIRERTRVKAAVVGRFTRARGRYEIAFESGRRRLRARGWDHLLRRRA